MFCPKCGSKLSDGARFCTECGLPLGVLSDKGTEVPESEPVKEGWGNATSTSQQLVNEGDSAEGASAPADSESAPAAPTAPAEDSSGAERSQMFNFFMQKRQIGSRLVPQFAIMIAAFIAAAGIAYAAFMLYKNVIEPNMQQSTQQEQVVKKSKKKAEKVDFTLRMKTLTVSVPLDPIMYPGERREEVWVYPQLESRAEGEIADRINKSILEPLMIDAERAERTSDMPDPVEGMYPDGEYPCITRKITVTYMSSSLFCIRDERYSTGWGPHGGTTVTGVEFDLETGETIRPQERLGLSPDMLADYIQSAVDMYATSAGDRLDHEGMLTKTDYKDYEIQGSTCLYFSDYGVVYRTSDYELGGYALGSVEVVIVPIEHGLAFGSKIEPNEVADGTTVETGEGD